MILNDLVMSITVVNSELHLGLINYLECIGNHGLEYRTIKMRKIGTTSASSKLLILVSSTASCLLCNVLKVF